MLQRNHSTFIDVAPASGCCAATDNRGDYNVRLGRHISHHSAHRRLAWLWRHRRRCRRSCEDRILRGDRSVCDLPHRGACSRAYADGTVGWYLLLFRTEKAPGVARSFFYLGPGSRVLKYLFAAASQDRSCRFIRTEILGAVDMQQLCQPRARTIDARFDRAHRATADAGSFFVRKPRCAY